MPETPSSKSGPAGDVTRSDRTAGWHVLLLAWPVYAGAFFAFSKMYVKPAADITNYQLLGIANKYASYVGAVLGLAAFLVTGIVYLVLRLIRRKPSRFVALILSALGYAPWLVLGYDLVYLEPRYAEVARAIITYLGKPMFYSAVIVCGAALLGSFLTLVFRRSK